MCLSNLYVVLKTGWSLGVTITACVVAYALFAALRSVGLVRREFGMLENNAMTSVAASAGFMTGGGNMAALPALVMLTGVHPSASSLVVWFAVIAALGVFAAIPIKRQLINVEQLPFPTGIATAETLKSLHGAGHHGSDKARRLGLAAVGGGLLAWFRDAHASWMPFNVPSKIGLLPFTIAGHSAKAWTLAGEGSLLLVGSGALMSFRTGWSMLLGAVVTYGVLAPAMVARGAIETVTYKAIVQWSLWAGAAVLLSSGLLSFAFQWRSVARSFRELAALVHIGRERGAPGDEEVDPNECPPSWFPLGFALLSPVVLYLMWRLFGIPLWAGAVAIPLSIVMGVVAARVTGETDTTPTKALGPVTQGVYGVMLPHNLQANLMGANVTGGVGLHAADLLTTLKCGYLLNASARQQFIAQLFGCVAGALVVVPAFDLLVPDASVLGGEAFPAPGAQVWAGVSQVLVAGLGALHPTARIGALCGALLGIALTLADRWAPPHVRRFLPTASGFGIAMVIPGYNSISMFIGATVAELVRRKDPSLAEKTVPPIASGFIAGESLIGIVVAVLVAFGYLAR